MKRNVTPFLLLSSLILTSCSGAKHAYAAYGITLLGNNQDIVQITEYDLMNYVNSGIGFTVVFHNDLCSVCTDAMKVIRSNIKDTNGLIFGVEVDDTNAKFIYDNLSDRIIQLYTPQVVTFSHKNTTYEFTYDNLLRKKGFNDEKKRLTIDSTFYYSTNIEEGLEKYNSLDNALLFTFSSQHKESYEFFTANIADLMKKNTQNVIIVDTFAEYFVDNSWKAEIENSFYISTKKAGVEHTPANYLKADQTNQAIEMATSYQPVQ